MSVANFVPGRFGNAASYNGSSTYLIKTHGAEDYPATGLPIYRAGSYTIAFWVNGAPQTGRYLFTEGNNSGTNQSVLLILQTGQVAANNAKFDVIIRSDTGGTAGTPVNHVVSSNVVFDSTWHHIAWVDDQGRARLYVDGNLDSANFNYTPVSPFSFNTTTIGALVRSAVGGYFAGLLDDVAVWERALTQAEVQQVMNNSLATPIPELPPYLDRVPTNATRAVGDRVTFTARAVGNRPLNFQWSRDSGPIEGATGPSLTLSNLTGADSGNYTVSVQNIDGTVGATATLTVLPDPEPDLRVGLISHWPFEVQNDDGLGGFTTPDLYSRNDMALVNMDRNNETPSISGIAYAFNGVDECTYRVGGFPIYNNPAYSVALWVNANALGQSDRRFFAESSTNFTNPLFTFGSAVGGTTTVVRAYVRNDAGGVILDRSSSRSALDGIWHHLVWTETNGRAKLYIDGALDETDFTYARTNLTLDQTVLGAIVRSTVGNYFAGVLDEVALWNRALTFTEIQQIRANGIPAPLAPTPPAITQDPVSQSVLTRSRVTFSFLATGTGPLLPQWRKNGVNLEQETNATLRFGSVTLDDASDYDVVVANAVGRATSAVATLTVTLRPPSPNELRIDFNNTGYETPVDTEPGFSSFALITAGTGPLTRTYGGADVTLTAIGTTMESRLRTTPSNAVDFTQEKLLRDFIFTRDAASDQGLDVTVEFLKPSTLHTVTVWSFDSGSAGSSRISDWSANGALVRGAYGFIGSALPTFNEQYRFSFDVTSDAQGTILIQGRRNSAAAGAINVFLNALQVIRREIVVQQIEFLAPDSLRLTIQVLNPAANHRFEQKVNLTDADWTEVTDVGLSDLGGNVLQAVFPAPGSGTRFYRVVQDP